MPFKAETVYEQLGGIQRNAPLEEALTVSVTAEITRSETPPQWIS